MIPRKIPASALNTKLLLIFFYQVSISIHRLSFICTLSLLLLSLRPFNFVGYPTKYRALFLDD
jgi:hypothetical protein